MTKIRSIMIGGNKHYRLFEFLYIDWENCIIQSSNLKLPQPPVYSISISPSALYVGGCCVKLNIKFHRLINRVSSKYPINRLIISIIINNFFLDYLKILGYGFRTQFLYYFIFITENPFFQSAVGVYFCILVRHII